MTAFTTLSQIVYRSRDIHCLEEFTDSIWPIMDLGTPDEAEFETIKEGRALMAACRRYSQDRPRVVVTKINSASSSEDIYDLNTLISGWQPNWVVLKVQINLTSFGEEFANQNDFRVTIDPDTGLAVLRWQRDSPGEPWAIHSIRDHITTFNECTIPLKDGEAVSQLLAHYALQVAANYFARKAQTQTMQGDSVNYGSLSSGYNRQAKDAIDKYMSLTKAQTEANCAFVNWQHDDGPMGELPFHRRSTR